MAIKSFAKQDAALKTEEFAQLQTLLDIIGAFIYIVDMKTCEILFVNKYAQEVWGDITGQTCWKVLQKGQNGPCEFCTNNELLNSDGTPAGVYTWEFQNTQNGRWYKCRDRAVLWPGGRMVRFEIATDVTDHKLTEETLRSRLKFEKMVAAISTRFANIQDGKLDETIERALQLSGEFFNVDRSYLFQFSGGGELMDNTHEWCAPGIEPQIDNLQGIPAEILPWWMEKLNRFEVINIYNVEDMPPSAAVEKEILTSQSIQSVLVVPMAFAGKLTGFIGFDSVEDNKLWKEEQISILIVLAEIVSNALVRQQREEEIRYISFHDSITRLYNRAFLEEEMKRLDTERQLPISIIMADLNGLKLVNDTYGHSTGDEMLQLAANILRSSCRTEDIIARWGGDEFVILLSQTVKDEAEDICKRINDKCREAYVGDVPISIAMGTATKSRTGENLAAILKEAEDNMYKQKLTESRSIRSGVLNALLKTLAAKSYETEEHARRMLDVAKKIGAKIGLSDYDLNRLSLLVTLHDIGKINISEEILTKKGSLNEKEWEAIKKHPEIGFRIARATEEFAHIAEDILAHHERWDGSGYPRGLKGKQIPLLARIVAIADAYEVLSNGRPYKRPFSKEEIIAEFIGCSGTHFDPELVDVFLLI